MNIKACESYVNFTQTESIRETHLISVSCETDGNFTLYFLHEFSVPQIASKFSHLNTIMIKAFLKVQLMWKKDISLMLDTFYAAFVLCRHGQMYGFK